MALYSRGPLPSVRPRGSDPEYDDLRRTWEDLLAGLPKIDGWTITEGLPEIEEMLYRWCSKMC